MTSLIKTNTTIANHLESQNIDAHRIIASLTDCLPVERIYVFGSRTRTDYRPDSDIDIYATVKDTNESWIDMTARARCSLDWLPVSRDVIVRTTHSFDNLAQDKSSIEKNIVQTGAMLYG